MTHPAQSRQIQLARLPNGIRVVTEHMPHVRSVSIGVWISAGSRHETRLESGISHFLEHMLFKGSATRSAQDIAREVDSIGGHLDAFTAKELVSYNTKIIDEHVPRAFDVLSDLVLRPRLDEEDIEKEKGVILEELKMELDNPEYMVHETFLGRFWKGHALGRPIIGTPKTIRRFSREMLSRFHQRVYRPEMMLITAAGHLDHDQLCRLAEDSFGRLPLGGPPTPEPLPAPHAYIALKRKRLQQVHICLGVPSHHVSHQRRYSCYILNTLLGGGMSSRLFQNIRERQGLAYAVFSELNLFRDTGCLAVYAGTSKENAGRVIQSILSEFKTLKDDLVPQDELRRAKDHLKGSLMLSLESTSSRMANLARQEMYFQRHFTLDEILESIEDVSAENIQELAQLYFTPAHLGLAVVGAPEQAIGPEMLIC
jgi:predicted Zn-dependent peptidase